MSEPSKGRGALAASGLAAILASTCCLGRMYGNCSVARAKRAGLT